MPKTLITRTVKGRLAALPPGSQLTVAARFVRGRVARSAAAGFAGKLRHKQLVTWWAGRVPERWVAFGVIRKLRCPFGSGQYTRRSWSSHVREFQDRWTGHDSS